MLRGMYTATSGMLTIVRDINVRSNNMANVGTAGFKEDRLVTTTFAEALAIRQEIRTMGEKVDTGGVTRGKKAVDIKTDFTQGALEQTLRSVDFAISGDGFFTILNEENEFEEETYYYTRNGQFQIDPEGYLIFDTGHYVADDTGSSIMVEDSNFVVTDRGVIYASDGTEIATLGIFVPDNPDLLIKRDDEAFSILDEDNEPDTLDFEGTILQGYIEKSNTNIASQMASLIADSRSYQSMSQIIKTIDGVLGKSVNEVGRV